MAGGGGGRSALPFRWRAGLCSRLMVASVVCVVHGCKQSYPEVNRNRLERRSLAKPGRLCQLFFANKPRNSANTHAHAVLITKLARHPVSGPFWVFVPYLLGT